MASVTLRYILVEAINRLGSGERNELRCNESILPKVP